MITEACATTRHCSKLTDMDLALRSNTALARPVLPYTSLLAELQPALEGMLLDPSAGLLFLPAYRQSFLHLGTLLGLGDPRLTSLLAQHPVHRRTEYAHGLYRLTTMPWLWAPEGLTPKQRTLVDVEVYFWQTLFRRELGSRGLLPDQAGGLFAIDGDHWRWQGREPRSGEPAMNIWGAKDVPVYRILWIVFRSDELLPSDRRPVRHTDSGCYEGESPACCNPHHFGLSRRSDRRRLPRYWRSDRNRTTLQPRMVRWFFSAQTGALHCQTDPTHRLTESSLGKYLRGEKLGTFLHCPGCNKLHEQDRQNALAQPKRREFTQDEIDDANAFIAGKIAEREARERQAQTLANPQLEGDI